MIVEEYTVKSAIDHVSNCAAQDQCHANQKSAVRFFLRHFPKVVSDSDHRRDSKRGERKLSKLIVPTNPKGHSGIQQIMKSEPITNHIDLLMQVHVFVHEQLRGLIDYNNDERDDEISVDLCVFH